MSTIGLICPSDHAVFGPVARRLRSRGVTVDFLPPGVEIPRDGLTDLDLLVNKKVRWASIRALADAYQAGVPAWTDYVATMVCLNRLSQLQALSIAGFSVPDVRMDPPAEPYVAKDVLDFEGPRLNGEGDFYQPLLNFDGVDHKYYAVDDGQTVQTAVVRFRSKLFGERERLGPGQVDADVHASLERLLAFTGAGGLGVDVVEVDGEPYALDANPATSFKHTGLDDALVDSLATAVDTE
jgi:hypothetical protein